MAPRTKAGAVGLHMDDAEHSTEHAAASITDVTSDADRAAVSEPTIIAVEPLSEGLVRLRFAEDAPPLDVPIEAWVDAGVRRGEPVPAERWTMLVGSAARHRALRAATTLLSRRARTAHEVAAALSGTHAPEHVAYALERLTALGYINDPAWAASYVAAPRAAERGRRLVQHELRRHGVDAPAAAAAVSGHDDLAAARRAAARRWVALSRLEPTTRDRRLLGFLLRRGFGGGIAQRVLHELVQGNSTG